MQLFYVVVVNVVSVNVVSVNVVSVNVVSGVLFYIYPKFSVDGACKGVCRSNAKRPSCIRCVFGFMPDSALSFWRSCLVLLLHVCCCDMLSVGSLSTCLSVWFSTTATILQQQCARFLGCHK